MSSFERLLNYTMLRNKPLAPHEILRRFIDNLLFANGN